MCQQSTITRELVDLEPTRLKNAFHNHGYNSPRTKIESITRTCISHFQWISDIVIKRSSFPFFVIPFGSIFTLIYIPDIKLYLKGLVILVCRLYYLGVSGGIYLEPRTFKPSWSLLPLERISWTPREIHPSLMDPLSAYLQL